MTQKHKDCDSREILLHRQWQYSMHFEGVSVANYVAIFFQDRRRKIWVDSSVFCL